MENPSLVREKLPQGTKAPPKTTGDRPAAGRVIGVFTSGGDSHGMNAAVRAVVRFGLYLGGKVFFIKEGYAGMVEGGDKIVEATWGSVSGIIHQGGTMIGSARSKEFRERPGRLKAALNLLKHNISDLIVIGGDGSLTGANVFRQEWPGLLAELKSKGQIDDGIIKRCGCLTIVGMIGSIDNDYCGSDMTIGVDSALHRIVELCDWISTTVNSHQRVGIVEVMGRHCGYLALVSGIVTEADYAFIPEWPPEGGDWPERLCSKLKAERENGQRFSMIIVSEGAIDRQGNEITAKQIQKIIIDRLGYEARVTVLGHPQRGGPPSVYDRMIGTRQGAAAIHLLLYGECSKDSLTSPAFVVAVHGNRIVRVPLKESVAQTQSVGTAMKERRFEDAVKLRGQTFERNLKICRMLNKLAPPACMRNERPNHRFGIVCVGEPTAGSNATIRAFVRATLSSCNSAYAVFDGLEGLTSPQGEVKDMSWTDVANWTSRGGTSIGSSCTLPSDQQMVDSLCSGIEKHSLRGLVILGDFQAFHTGILLAKASKTNPTLGRVLICVVPASSTNNITGCDLSIGADSALNDLVYLCDSLRERAYGSLRRVFLVKTLGGSCGYLPIVAGLSSAAEVAYVAENPTTEETLARDAKNMEHKILNRNECGLLLWTEGCPVPASKIVSTFQASIKSAAQASEERPLSSSGSKAAAAAASEGTPRKRSRGSVKNCACALTVQTRTADEIGARPSPFDRNYGSQMGVLAAEWLDAQASASEKVTPANVILLGLSGREFKYKPILELEALTDFEKRRPKSQPWSGILPLLRILGKHDSKYDPNLMWEPQ